MIITPHILASVALSRNIRNIYLLPFISFFFHFLIDAIPHWDYKPLKMNFKKALLSISIDYFIAISVIFILGFFSNWNVFDYGLAFLASFFGILPDIISVCAKLYFKKNRVLILYRRFHKLIHIIKIDDFNKGFYQQVAVAIIAVVMIIYT